MIVPRNMQNPPLISEEETGNPPDLQINKLLSERSRFSNENNFVIEIEQKFTNFELSYGDVNLKNFIKYLK